MERTLKNWFISSETPIIVQFSARTLLLVSILVFIALTIIFAAPSDFIPIEELYE